MRGNVRNGSAERSVSGVRGSVRDGVEILRENGLRRSTLVSRSAHGERDVLTVPVPQLLTKLMVCDSALTETAPARTAAAVAADFQENIVLKVWVEGVGEENVL